MRRWFFGLSALAGIYGACGVGAAAAAAHLANAATMSSVALILLVHAAALLALAALATGEPEFARWVLPACGAMALGALLFAADVSLRALAGTRLFPMAAPTGGILLIASWVLVALAGLRAVFRREVGAN